MFTIQEEKPRPAVGMLLSKEFNGTIAMNLKMYNQNTSFHD